MAVPDPEQELTRLRKLVQRGLPPVTLLSGANGFFRSEALEVVLAAVPDAAELRTIDAVDERAAGDAAIDDEEDDEDVPADAAEDGIAACPELLDLRGGGLFAKSAWLIVKRGKNWWKRHAATLAAQVPHFRKGSCCVIEADKLDKRKKVAAALVKSVAEAGAFFEFRELYELPFDRSAGLAEGELARWVVGRSGRMGVALTSEAACLLITQVGRQPAELVAELGRLRDRLGSDGKRAPLDPAALRGQLTVSFESTPFEFAEAVLDRDHRRALRSVRAMFARGVRDKAGKTMDTGGLLPFTTSWMFRSFAAVYEGRLLLASGVAERDVPMRVGVRQFVPRFVDHLRGNDLARLERGLRALHACQRASRTTGEDPEVLLERFLAQCFAGAPIPGAEEFEA